MRRLLVVVSLVLGCVGTANIVTGGAVSAADDSYVPITPIRVADSRPEFPGYGPLPIAKSPTTNGGLIRIPISRWGAVRDASAVAVNLTATRTTTGGYLTLFSCDGTPPATSNLNLQPGHTVANLAFTKLSVDGDICIYPIGTTDVVVDVVGYVPKGATQLVAGPLRIADSRPDFPSYGPSPIAKVPTTTGGTIRLPVTSWAGAGDAKAVAVNLTATRSTTRGYLTVYSCDTAPPATSNLNLQPGNTVANLAFTRVGASGDICIRSVGTTHVIVDLVGAIPDGSTPIITAPQRIGDTRTDFPIYDPSVPKTPTTSGGTIRIPVTKWANARNASAVVINLTATRSTSAGYLTVYACDVAAPDTSNLNLQPGNTVANLVTTKVSASGEICILTVGTTDLIVDLMGNIPKGGTTPTTSTTSTTTTSTTSTTLVPPQPVCSINGTSVTTTISQTECDALMAFYNATGGANWSTNDGWNTATDPCTWHGVTCTNGNVTTLAESNNGLQGAIPAETAQLTKLATLDLDKNKITGVPADLPAITELDLGFNQLTTVPPEIASLTSLTNLNLAGNGLATFPIEITSLPNLTHLTLYGNDITTIPGDIGKLKNLTNLDVKFNDITAIPPEIGQLTNLTVAIFDANELTTLPVELGQLTNLQELTLYGNKISGDVSAVFAPLVQAADTTLTLILIGNNCPTASDPAVKAWLDVKSPGWDTC